MASVVLSTSSRAESAKGGFHQMRPVLVLGAQVGSNGFGRTAHEKLPGEIHILVEPVEVMHRAVAVADAKTISGHDRTADERLGVAHGGCEVLAPRETGGDRR